MTNRPGATRREQLLDEAAKEFARLASPFDPTWLYEHNVTLDECGDLSEDVARAIRFYLATPLSLRINAAVREAIVEAGREARDVQR